MKVKSFFLVVSLVLMSACGNSETVSRIPDASVNLRANIDYYGLTTPYTYKSFTSKQGLPETTFLGYGGILLIGGIDFNGDHVAYYAFDLSCPVEARPDIKVGINKELLQAECPKCKSRYAVFEGAGYPTFGEAKEKSYYLRRYTTRLSGRDVIVTR
ncbi:MAG: hypothetical protein ACRCX4_00845 [Bacteroidales bacterium]